MRYRDLPQHGNGRGVAMMCRNPVCPQTEIPYSPDRGDYWLFPSADVVRCGDCGRPMVLARHVDRWESLR
jgi:hypothetical protein